MNGRRAAREMLRCCTDEHREEGATLAHGKGCNKRDCTPAYAARAGDLGANKQYTAGVRQSRRGAVQAPIQRFTQRRIQAPTLPLPASRAACSAASAAGRAWNSLCSHAVWSASLISAIEFCQAAPNR